MTETQQQVTLRATDTHTLSKGIAVVDEFLGNTSGNLMANFFKTLTGREHALGQGAALVLT